MFLNILIVLVLAVFALAVPTPAFNGTSLQVGESIPSEAPSRAFETGTPATPPPDSLDDPSSDVHPYFSHSDPFSFRSNTLRRSASLRRAAALEHPASSSDTLQVSSPAPIVPTPPKSSPFSSRYYSSSSQLAPIPTTGPAEISAYLSIHNSVRAAHGASPLTWSSDLAQVAQTWANRCELRHSDGELGPYGENLAAGAGHFPVQNAVKLFINEPYDAANPTFTHFTQVVWKSTTQLGCAVALCDGIFDSKWGQATYHVCMYNPVGNVVGEEQLNVQA